MIDDLYKTRKNMTVFEQKFQEEWTLVRNMISDTSLEEGRYLLPHRIDEEIDRDPRAYLHFVKDHTIALCARAVTQDWRSLRLCQVVTDDIIDIALKQNQYAILSLATPEDWSFERLDKMGFVTSANLLNTFNGPDGAAHEIEADPYDALTCRFKTPEMVFRMVEENPETYDYLPWSLIEPTLRWCRKYDPTYTRGDYYKATAGTKYKPRSIQNVNADESYKQVEFAIRAYVKGRINFTTLVGTLEDVRYEFGDVGWDGYTISDLIKFYHCSERPLVEAPFFRHLKPSKKKKTQPALL